MDTQRKKMLDDLMLLKNKTCSMVPEVRALSGAFCDALWANDYETAARSLRCMVGACANLMEGMERTRSQYYRIPPELEPLGENLTRADERNP